VALVGVAAVFLSASRGGVLGLAAGIVTAIVVSSLQRGGATRAWVLLLLVGLIVVVLLPFVLDPVLARLASSDLSRQAERPGIVRDLSNSWRDFLLLGSGLNTLPLVFPIYDSTAVYARAEFADCDWAQLVTETGVVGVALTGWFLLLVLRAWWQALRGEASSAGAAATGLTIGLVAILLQSGGDYGQRIPGVAAMTACMFAALLNLQHLRRADARSLAQAPVTRRPLAAALPFVLLLAGVAWAGWDAVDAGRAERSYLHGVALEQQLRRREWAGTNAEWEQLWRHTYDARVARPGNAYYRYWDTVHRQNYLDRFAGTRDAIKPEEAAVALDAYNEVRRRAPTFGPAIARAGDVQYNLLGQTGPGEQKIRLGRQYAKTDPDAAFLMGQVELRNGHPDAAVPHYLAAASIAPAYRALAVDDLLKAGAFDAAADVARPVPTAMADVIRRLAEQKQDAAASRARTLYRDDLVARLGRGDVPPAELAELGRLRLEDRQFDESVQLYRRALAVNVFETDWRLNLARALEGAGRTEDALKEAEACLRQRNDDVSRAYVADLQRKLTPTTGPATAPAAARPTPPAAR
jgi:tetratricopeptide (TPR) repeat protein